MLNPEQIGHLRHFDDLSRQLPNDWSSMQGKGVGQDDFGGYRFQLAYMAYALALAHVHRRKRLETAKERKPTPPWRVGAGTGVGKACDELAESDLGLETGERGAEADVNVSAGR